MATDSRTASLASTLVARFLRSNNYTQTLDVFIREAGLSADAGQTGEKEDSNSDSNSSNWTIERVLEEKKTFDKSLKFEKYGDDGQEKDLWSEPGQSEYLFERRGKKLTVYMKAPSKPIIIQTPTESNFLAASVEPWQQQQQTSNHNEAPSPPSYIVATGADKQLHLLKTADGNDVVNSFAGHSDSPILSYTSVRDGRYMFMTNMSGQLILQRGAEVLGQRKDHSKYAIRVIAYEDPDNTETVLVATAGWDSKVCVYVFNLPVGDDEEAESVPMGEPVAYINLATNPESMLFVRQVDLGRVILLVSRSDSTHLYYYQVDSLTSPTTTTTTIATTECKLLGKQNLAPHSNSWVTFSPSSIALSPLDPGLLAVATSTLPHMKVILVRLLFPPAESFDDANALAPPELETQSMQAFAALTLQNREEAAILVQANTFAPQTAYSTPQVVWRPDGSGVWVNGDDGVIRGVEAKTGKAMAVLKHGHQAGYKVRTIWAGWVDVPRDGGEVVVEEWVVSGGFDKRLIVWKGDL